MNATDVIATAEKLPGGAARSVRVSIAASVAVLAF
jgi:hypothetical protein